jgi:DHA1 family tetracycline resistance protein-like MFS transporter
VRKPALSFIFVTLFLDILGIGLIVPILPKLIEELSHGNVTSASHRYGWLMALYCLMQFLCAPAIGGLSDRFGRRPVILISLLGSGLDYLLLALAPSLPWFFLGRIIAGITGANITAASAYIADVSPPEKRAANFGIVGAAFGLGFVAGPFLGGLLGDYGLRYPFFAAAGLTLLNWLYGLFVLPESLSRENRRAFDWSRANPVGSFVALKRHPAVWGLAETYFLMQLAHLVFPSTWVLYTGYRYHWSPKEVGISLAIVGIMAAIVQGGLARKMIPLLGERRAIVLGLTNSVVFFTLYGLATQGWMIYCLIIVASICQVAMPAVQGLISRNVPPNEQGGVQGALTSLASLTGILGPLLYTNLFGYFVSEKAPVLLPGIACFTGAFLMFVALLLVTRALQKIPVAQAAPPATSAPVAK